MESHKKKDGTEKSLFDYSKQNQNYLIIDDLIQHESDNNLVPIIHNRKQAKKIYNKIGAKFGSWKECTPCMYWYKDKKRYLQVDRYKFKHLFRLYENTWLAKPHKDATSFKNIGRLVHDISHYMQEYRNENIKHSRQQSILELEITLWIIDNNWFKEEL
tara:strand:- start:2755 stop:3231 length:477 start_codon:yes stop_codon:yes gene_type:complete